jgi:hypothetical protein
VLSRRPVYVRTRSDTAVTRPGADLYRFQNISINQDTWSTEVIFIT